MTGSGQAYPQRPGGGRLRDDSLFMSALDPLVERSARKHRPQAAPAMRRPAARSAISSITDTGTFSGRDGSTRMSDCCRSCDTASRDIQPATGLDRRSGGWRQPVDTPKPLSPAMVAAASGHGQAPPEVQATAGIGNFQGSHSLPVLPASSNSPVLQIIARLALDTARTRQATWTQHAQVPLDTGAATNIHDLQSWFPEQIGANNCLTLRSILSTY